MRWQFGEFHEKVRAADEKAVLRAVGIATDRYKDDHWLKSPQHFDTEELFFEAFFGNVRALTGRTRHTSPAGRESVEPFTDLVRAWRKGRGDPELAIAAYYFLCREIDDQSYARSVDLAVFQGLTFVPAAPHIRPTLEVSSPMLPRPRNHFFGRDTELNTLLASLSSSQTRMIQIVAPGGYGKTSLAVEMLAMLAKENYRDLDRVFEWTFYRPGTIDNDLSSAPFFDAAYDFFGGPRPAGINPRAEGAALATAITKSKSLLIIDGLEPFQYPPSHPLSGDVKDVAISAMLHSVALRNEGLCVVTTRVPIAGLNPHTVRTIHLGPLEDAAAVGLLTHLGVKGDESSKRAAAAAVLCNPLSLALLGNWLREEHGGRAEKHKTLSFAQADAEYGGHTWRLMQRYHAWLGSEYADVLTLVGYFERPAKEEELVSLVEALRAEGRFDWTDADIAVGLQRRLRRLASLGLFYELEPVDYRVDCHPLIREFERNIAKSLPVDWEIGNRTLRDRLLSKVPDRPQLRSELLRTYEALHHSVEAGDVQFAFQEILVRRLWRNDYDQHPPVENFYSTRELSLLSEDLRALERFFVDPFERCVTWLDARRQRALFSQAGFLLSSLLRLRQSVRAQEIAYKLAIDAKDWKGASIAAGSSAEYCLLIGEMQTARELATKAVAANASFEDAHPDRIRWTIAGFATAGMIEYETNDWSQAQANFDQAISLHAQTTGPIAEHDTSDASAKSRYVLRASGYYILSSMLGQVESKVWQQQYEASNSDVASELADIIEWANYALSANPRSPDFVPLYDGLFRSVLGLASVLKAFVTGDNPERFLSLIQESIASFEESGIDRMRPLGLLAMATARRYVATNDAKSNLHETEFVHRIEQVEQISLHGPLVRFHLQAQLERVRMEIGMARLHGKNFSLATVDAAIDKALDLKYRRILVALEDARRVAMRSGLA